MEPQYVDIHTHCPTGRGIEPKAAGIHPWDADKEDLASLAGKLDGVEALGEIGLDYTRPVDRERQRALFRAQLSLARERELPVVVHCVRAFEDAMRELAARPPRAVIFHGFIGSVEQARRAIGRGYYLSFGERTFRSPRTLEALRETPLAQLFLETDDSPIAIKTVYARIAEALATDVETLKRATTENYARIFLPPPTDPNKTPRNG